MASGNVDGLVSCSSSSSMKLLLFMIPLLVVSGCVSVLGSRNSGWGFNSRYPWLWSSPTAKPPQVPATKPKEGHLDLHSTVVGVHRREEAISEDSVVNRSSSPPLAVQPARPPPAASVRLHLLLSICSCFFFCLSSLNLWYLTVTVFNRYHSWIEHHFINMIIFGITSYRSFFAPRIIQRGWSYTCTCKTRKATPKISSTFLIIISYKMF